VDPSEIEASGREGLAVQEVIEAAIRSHESGQAESVPTLVLNQVGISVIVRCGS
jgi:hypothetical protein